MNVLPAPIESLIRPSDKDEVLGLLSEDPRRSEQLEAVLAYLGSKQIKVIQISPMQVANHGVRMLGIGLGPSFDVTTINSLTSELHQNISGNLPIVLTA